VAAPIISVVDDDELLRDAVRRLLRSHGYAVHTFASAEDFLKSDLPDKSSSIISDVQLPKMDGLALQAQLQARGNMVPVIFITAYPNAATEARAKKAGAVCVLHKPFDSEVLIACLNAALKGGS
jgi:FixJ family two-component response regulator